MKLTLIRTVEQKHSHVEGVLFYGGQRLETIEQKWNDNVPYESCIQEGTYRLIPHTRPNGDKCYAIVNEDLGVYLYEEDIPAGESGRFLILIHIGNIVDDCVGCILPGLGIGVIGMKRAVVSSGLAINRLLALLGREEEHEIEIKWI